LPFCNEAYYLQAAQNSRDVDELAQVSEALKIGKVLSSEVLIRLEICRIWKWSAYSQYSMATCLQFNGILYFCQGE